MAWVPAEPWSIVGGGHGLAEEGLLVREVGVVSQGGRVVSQGGRGDSQGEQIPCHRRKGTQLHTIAYNCTQGITLAVRHIREEGGCSDTLHLPLLYSISTDLVLAVTLQSDHHSRYHASSVRSGLGKLGVGSRRYGAILGEIGLLRRFPGWYRQVKGVVLGDRQNRFRGKLKMISTLLSCDSY